MGIGNVWGMGWDIMLTFQTLGKESEVPTQEGLD
jgi:hypothetical protein